MLALRYVPLVLAHLAQLILADHKICSWHDAGDESPSKYYYQRYCLANPKVQNDSHVRYFCPPDDNNRHQDLIADYGWLKPETLEFGACERSESMLTGLTRSYPSDSLWWRRVPPPSWRGSPDPRKSRSSVEGARTKGRETRATKGPCQAERWSAASVVRC